MERNDIIDIVAADSTDRASDKDLRALFYDNEVGYLSGLPTEELIDLMVDRGLIGTHIGDTEE